MAEGSQLFKEDSRATLTRLTLTQRMQFWIDTSVDAPSPFNSQHFYRILPVQ
jgi:hypothetical protein